VFVYTNYRQVVKYHGDTHQLRERLYNGFILLPIYWKQYIVPQVMTRGIVTTNKV